jgi:hypothetical protein
MFQNTNNSRGFETTLVSEVVPSAPTRRSLSALFASRAGSLMLQDAMLEAGHDRCRALLAQSALQNTGSIAAMATRLSSIAPMGSEHYRSLLDAYAKGATEQLERW